MGASWTLPCHNPEYSKHMQNPYFRHVTDRMQDKLLYLEKFSELNDQEEICDLCAPFHVCTA